MLWAYRGSWIFALGDESSNARFMSEGWTLWISHEPFCYSEEELGSCSCLVARTVGQRMWNLSKCEEQLFIDIVTSVVMAWCTLKRDTCRLCQLVHFKDPCWWPLQHRRRWMCSAVCLQDMVYLNNMSPTPDHNSFHQTLKGSWKRIELEPHCITLPQMEKQKDLFRCQTLFAINGSGSMSTKLSTILISHIEILPAVPLVCHHVWNVYCTQDWTCCFPLYRREFRKRKQIRTVTMILIVGLKRIGFNNAGLLVHLVHQCTGSLVHWFTGALVHRFTGSLVSHWFTGVLVHLLVPCFTGFWRVCVPEASPHIGWNKVHPKICGMGR